ncbi:HAD superfamily hydrolase, related to HypE [Desulfonema limicola]|uniref:HAD superfamily hydrolase, related to HypE n=1 Tax=Desulfonema limicola TaxID=45656 RepID=A0A975GEP7_9BACT|nr:HAD-IA family hydrolase [Desulfonema limicola]QTA78344.1 HAD superfamily hydrolase, related to HypE [Desulfonema limicola]
MKNVTIKAVLFDFDSTLTLPGAIDFFKIKQAVQCPADMPVLEYINNIDDPIKKADCFKILDKLEKEAAERSKPNHGAEELIYFLKHEKGLKTGIITRNSLGSVKTALENFNTIKESDFDLIITRDDPIEPKPSPEGVLLAALKMNLAVEEILVAGDFIFDILAGKNAGASTVYLTNNDFDDNSGLSKKFSSQAVEQSDYTASTLKDIKDIVRLHLPLLGGKFPNDLLERFLKGFDFNDPFVIIHPGIGEDTAAINVDNEEVLILKSDPITFATDSIGHYAVLINANDIATSGAVPRWFLSTLIFPCKTVPAEIFNTLEDLKNVCRKWNITLCGGHTEISDAVNRPVISGMLAGTVSKSGLIDKKSVKTGDRVLLTKGLAVEGSTIIAREFESRLLALGMQKKDIDTCRHFLSQLSIIEEAKIASEFKGITAMHDVTEGGLATALEELSIAAGYKIKVQMENIPIFPQTMTICELLNINPLGLIGSGSLIICCCENICKELIARIFKAGIKVTYIGEVTGPGQGIDAFYEGEPVEWPKFESDEITKLFE